MSALTPAGSTRRWRTIRQQYADHLAARGVVLCWRHRNNLDRADDIARGDTPRPHVDQSPDCAGTIRHGDRWVLGHRTDRIHGGTDNHLGYECAPCSSYTGARTGNALRNAARRITRRRRAW